MRRRLAVALAKRLPRLGLRNKTGDPAGAAGEDLLDGTVLVAGVAGIEHEFLISGATICCGID